MLVRKGQMMASVAFSDVLASAREPGTSRFSAIGIADALGIQFQDLAALAGVHRNTLRTHPESPRLQTRSEEHTSELQSLMRISYAVFCLKKKTTHSKPYSAE